jgi:hypothetical protein
MRRFLCPIDGRISGREEAEIDSPEGKSVLFGLDETPNPERAAPNDLGVWDRLPFKESSILYCFSLWVDPGEPKER